MEKQKLNSPKTTIAFLFFIMLLGCASKQGLSTNTDKIEKTPKIIFLNYTIKKTSDGKKTIRYINKKVTEGKLKNHTKNSKEEPVTGDLMCYQLDKKSNILHSTIIKNPFTKTFEFVDESKSFQMKKIDLDSSRFSLRLQLKPNTKYISIHNISNSKNKTIPLIKTKLN
ncbi:hypothetical protein [Flavivirga spongiicola]|uniref:DUF4833 domain-containing protein n=1 Tax=Flavivirga spongiicola TaxID=421621 RepID=A0ABU7XQK9_9FLAO|nr:hypothetical protein [Flavivirga sp. MEBiC05379]MDO5978040.1 hypothetical protein [Flavivirga sp. MEBiC05379]